VEGGITSGKGICCETSSEIVGHVEEGLHLMAQGKKSTWCESSYRTGNWERHAEGGKRRVPCSTIGVLEIIRNWKQSHYEGCSRKNGKNSKKSTGAVNWAVQIRLERSVARSGAQTLHGNKGDRGRAADSGVWKNPLGLEKVVQGCGI